MFLHLFGNYVFPFYDKSLSYTGFEVRKILLFCIRNAKIITILIIQKLSKHDNQISKTKIWNSNIAFILAQFWKRIYFNFWLFQSGKLGTLQCFFFNHCCKYSNCEIPCHKCFLWNQMNRCKIVSCKNNIVSIPIIFFLLTIITFIFWKPYFPVIFLP